MSLLITSPSTSLAFAVNDTNAAFLLLPTNFYTSPPIQSEVTFTIGTGTAAVGSFIELFGVKLYSNTFSDSYNFKYEPTNAGGTIVGIIDALNANFKTSGKFDWSISGSVVIFTWNQAGDNSSFSFVGSDKVVLTAQTKGSYFILKNGYQIIWEGHYFDNTTGEDRLLTRVHKTGPIFKQSQILETPILLNRYVSDILKTDTSDAIFFGNTIRLEKGAWRKVYLKASDTELINGDVIAMQPYTSETITFVNARLKNDEINLYQYYTGAAFDLTKFLNQKKYKTVCRNQYFNLYLITGSEPNLKVKTIIKDINGNESETFSTLLSQNFNESYITIIPAGPIQLGFAPNITSYSIQVGTESLLGFTPYSEEIKICIDDCDCEKEELYFVSEKGAYDTIRFQEIDERSINVSQVDYKFVEHFKSVGINLDRKLKSNIRQTNTISKDSITLVYEQLNNDEATMDFMRQFLESEYRFIKRIVNGQPRAVSFILEASETVIYKRGDLIDLIIKGYIIE